MYDKIFLSLTSIFDNQKILLETLKSIKQQTIPIDKCYIFLSEEPFLLDKGFPNKIITNTVLNDFIKENTIFEIRWVENEGPYRKLIPLLKEKWDDDCIIITVDDDTFYNNKLIENYINDYKKYNCCVSYRGFTFKMEDILKINVNYSKSKDKLKNLNLYNFCTGKGGVLYHPSFFKNTGDLIFNKNIYLTEFSTTDDIWFNFVRIANNINCYINTVDQFMIKDNTNSSTALFHKYNSIENKNGININKIITLFIKMELIKI